MRIHVAHTRTKITKCGKPVGKRLWWVTVSVAKSGGIMSYDCPGCRKAMKLAHRRGGVT